MTRLRAILLAWFLAVSLVTLWGHTVEWFYLAGITHVFEVFWGRLVLVDFAASLVLLGVWIAMLHPPEQRVTRGVAWTLLVLVLGTPAALGFFLLRTRTHPGASQLFLGRSPGAEPQAGSG